MRQTILICDKCDRENRGIVKATERLTVSTLAHGRTTLDLCEEDFQAILAALPLNGAPKTSAHKTNPHNKPKGNGKGRMYKCRYGCGFSAPGPTKLSKHYQQEHGDVHVVGR